MVRRACIDQATAALARAMHRPTVMTNPIVHWELMVGDVERAKAFYGRIFGWQFSPLGPEYTTVDTGGTPGGGLMAKPPSAPAAALNVYFQVESIDKTLRDVVEAGGTVVVPKTPIPPGWFAMFVDPDGIPIGVLEHRA
jgi:predicted enzyme related to lactoylglutathione lyase